jgi:hypothetical protein
MFLFLSVYFWVDVIFIIDFRSSFVLFLVVVGFELRVLHLLVFYYLNHTPRPRGSFVLRKKLASGVVQACKPSIEEVEAGG